MLNVSVKNGTNAGWKRPQSHVREDWHCSNCKQTVRYYWTKCPRCATERH